MFAAGGAPSSYHFEYGTDHGLRHPARPRVRRPSASFRSSCRSGIVRACCRTPPITCGSSQRTRPARPTGRTASSRPIRSPRAAPIPVRTPSPASRPAPSGCPTAAPTSSSPPPTPAATTSSPTWRPAKRPSRAFRWPRTAFSTRPTPARSPDLGTRPTTVPIPTWRPARANGWTTNYMGLPADIDPAAGSFSSVLGEADSALSTFAFAGPNLCGPCFTGGGLKTGIPLRLPNGQLVQGMTGSLAGSVDANGQARRQGRQVLLPRRQAPDLRLQIRLRAGRQHRRRPHGL